jgi:hypothetical protein
MNLADLEPERPLARKALTCLNLSNEVLQLGHLDLEG